MRHWYMIHDHRRRVAGVMLATSLEDAWEQLAASRGYASDADRWIAEGPWRGRVYRDDGHPVLVWDGETHGHVHGHH